MATTISIGNFSTQIELIPNINSNAVSIEVIDYSDGKITFSFSGFPFKYINSIMLYVGIEVYDFTANKNPTGNDYTITLDHDIINPEATLTVMKPTLREMIPFNASTTAIEFEGAVCGPTGNAIVFTIGLNNSGGLKIECAETTNEALNENEDMFICTFNNQYSPSEYGKKELYYENESNKVGDVFISTDVDNEEFVVDVPQKQPVFGESQFVIRSDNYFVKDIKYMQLQSMVNNTTKLVSTDNMAYDETDVSFTFNVNVSIGDRLSLTGFSFVNEDAQLISYIILIIQMPLSQVRNLKW